MSIAQKCNADGNPSIGCMWDGNSCTCDEDSECNGPNDTGCWPCVDWTTCQAACGQKNQQNCGSGTDHGGGGGGGIPANLAPCLTSKHNSNYWESDDHCVADLTKCCTTANNCHDGPTGMCGGNCQTSAQNYCADIYGPGGGGGGGNGGGGGGNGPQPGPHPAPPRRQTAPAKKQQFLEKPEGKTVATVAAVGGPLLVAWLLALVL